MADVPIPVPVGSVSFTGLSENLAFIYPISVTNVVLVGAAATTLNNLTRIPGVGSLTLTPTAVEGLVPLFLSPTSASLSLLGELEVLPLPTITKTHNDPFYLGQANATFEINVENETAFDWTNETIITDILPTGLTLVSMEGEGWSCIDNACTRSDTLASGESFPPITVTVSIATDITTSLTNIVQLVGFTSHSDNITFAEYIATPVRTPTRWALHQFSMKFREEERA